MGLSKLEDFFGKEITYRSGNNFSCLNKQASTTKKNNPSSVNVTSSKKVSTPSTYASSVRSKISRI